MPQSFLLRPARAEYFVAALSFSHWAGSSARRCNSHVQQSGLADLAMTCCSSFALTAYDMDEAYSEQAPCKSRVADFAAYSALRKFLDGVQSSTLFHEYDSE